MKAARLKSKAMAHKEEGQLDEAEALLREAKGINPTSASVLRNLGLVLQLRGSWQEALENHQQALKLKPAEEEWWWDVGINATAVGDWATARKAWAKSNVEIPPGEGPIEMPVGPAAVRVRVAEVPEVVWVDRIDPTRAILESVPLPISRRRWKDLVVHNGSQNGSRHREGKGYPVFDELGVIEPSPYKTFGIVARIEPRPAAKDLVDRAEAAGLGGIDWQGSIRFLCETCLTGIPHELHKHEVKGGEWLFGIAAKTEEEVHAVTQAWAEAWPDSELVNTELLFDE